MNDFAFHTPSSLKEAAELLAQYDGDARVMSGGTALMLLLKQSLVNPDHIISLHRVPEARSIEVSDGVLHIGGLVTQREMELSPVVREATPLLANAYSRVATVRIRNAATVGGGLAQADPAMDPPSSLLVLNASVKVTSASGERIIPIADWYSDYYETPSTKTRLSRNCWFRCSRPTWRGRTSSTCLAPRTTTRRCPSRRSAKPRTAKSLR